MKKIMLLCSGVLVSAVVADTPSMSGYYAGANVGLARPNVQYDYNDPTRGANKQKHTDSGMQYGAFGGYNKVMGSHVVVGAELFGGGDSSKVKTYSTASSTTNPGPTEIKRTVYYGVAPRVGYMVAPHTMAYARLGVEGGQWKANYNAAGSFLTTPSPSQSTVKKNTASFAPGVGVDMMVVKNVFMRAQYHHLFGPTLKTNTSYASGTSTQSFKTSQDVLALGVGYKF